MALILGPTECSICGRMIEAHEECVCFDHFLGKEHPLWEFSDSAMHKSCFESWPHRDEFAALRQVVQEVYQRIPAGLSEEEAYDWFVREAKRLGLE